MASGSISLDAVVGQDHKMTCKNRFECADGVVLRFLDQAVRLSRSARQPDSKASVFMTSPRLPRQSFQKNLEVRLMLLLTHLFPLSAQYKHNRTVVLHHNLS